jgi:hypothetical protein
MYFKSAQNKMKAPERGNKGFKGKRMSGLDEYFSLDLNEIQDRNSPSVLLSSKASDAQKH